LRRRARGWDELAEIAGQERRDLEARTGKPVFIIGEHYGFTSQITFLPAGSQGARRPRSAGFFLRERA